MSARPVGPTPEEIGALEEWAEAGDFSDVEVTRTLRGAEARAAGRAMVEAAGVDVAALERARIGRPPLDDTVEPGTTSPVWHVRAPRPLDAAARLRADAEGRDLSSLVRDAVQAYLAAS